MTATTAPTSLPGREREPELVRFERTERIVHWCTATLFLTLMATGAALYAGPVSTLVGRRELVRTVHVIAGLALPVPLVLGLVGRWGKGLRRDLGRLNRWRRGDGHWFRRKRRASVRLGKFNPGQKLNAVFLAAAGVVMFGTGIMLKWFNLFPLDDRTGATFVHDWFAIGIWIAVAGHIMFALRDPVALGAMLRGKVPARWARTNRPLWYEEETGRSAPQKATEPRATPAPERAVKPGGAPRRAP
jgi:formate dehydrogenase subunit gamma